MQRTPLAAELKLKRDEDDRALPAMRIAAEDMYTVVDSDPSLPARAILIALPLAAILWVGIALLFS